MEKLREKWSRKHNVLPLNCCWKVIMIETVVFQKLKQKQLIAVKRAISVFANTNHTYVHWILRFFFQRTVHRNARTTHRIVNRIKWIYFSLESIQFFTFQIRYQSHNEEDGKNFNTFYHKIVYVKRKKKCYNNNKDWKSTKQWERKKTNMDGFMWAKRIWYSQ